ncbi:Cof-type HAD-IIB family hydrolase [Tannockella kyphosi]|uniref:Cof-type HAD-IIB family hydrolase n=1 Tax=Tannockella kyphosi TaxID=2899121 RepID=UPI0020112435|nr:Cof-type HAD-IIB family hydrolase [Tannockella kyphosi]
MEKKIIFFDIDGTLVYEENGIERIREKTKEAIALTRKKGNYVFLCTGRSKPEVYDFIWDLGIDGLIGAGGGYVEILGEVLYHHCFSKQDVLNVLDYFEKYNFDYYLESNGGLFASKNLVERLEFLIYGDYHHDIDAKKRKESKSSHFINALQTNQTMLRNDITKICFLENTNVSFEKIIQQFSNHFTIHHCTVPIFGNNSGELSLLDINKAKAIHDTLVYLGINKENTFAFGDGLNDIEMLEYCHTGIAMGNAKEKLKEIADEVCACSHEDGIYETMLKYKLC